MKNKKSFDGQNMLLEPVRGAALLQTIDARLLSEPSPTPELLSGELDEMVVTVQRPEGGSARVAVVTIRNMLMQHEDWISWVYDATTYDQLSRLAANIRMEALAGRLDGVFMDVDSPGGQAAGSFDCADEWLQVSDVMPVVALARDLCASGAYLLACTATELLVTQSGEVGSIGVVKVHTSEQKALEQAGYEVTAITAGEDKVSGAWWQQLSEHARALIQTSVDYTYELFLSKVMAGRGLSREQIVALGARMYRGQGALDAGLADGVANFNQAMGRLLNLIQARRGEDMGRREQLMAALVGGLAGATLVEFVEAGTGDKGQALVVVQGEQRTVPYVVEGAQLKLGAPALPVEQASQEELLVTRELAAQAMVEVGIAAGRLYPRHREVHVEQAKGSLTALKTLAEVARTGARKVPERATAAVSMDRKTYQGLSAGEREKLYAEDPELYTRLNREARGL